MTDLLDPDVQALLSAPNYGVISTQNGDGSILSTVVWVGYENGVVSINSALGRRWPANVERDPHATLVVIDPQNPSSFVEVRGTLTGTLDGAVEHANQLSNKYIGRDYPWLQPQEQRIRFELAPDRVRLVKR